MAFCTSCGSNMDPNAHFCTKCGKPISPAGTSPAAAAAAPAPVAVPPVYAAQPAPASGGGNALKIILIVLAVIVVLVGGMIATVTFIGYRAAKRIKHDIRVSQDGKSSTVDFGGGFKASTNTVSARDLAHKIGVDIYPGARDAGDSAEAQFGNMTTATIKLSTSDSVQKVADFYKSRYNSAMSSMDGDKFSLVAGDQGGTITINVEDEGGSTKIEIAKVSGMKIEVK